MRNKYRKSKRFPKPYTEEDVKKAIQTIEVDGVSINKASKMYLVPEATLRRRVQNGTPKARTIFSMAQEKKLKEYFQYLASRNFPLDRELANRVVVEFAKSLKIPNFNHKPPQRDWWEGFMDRHKELSWRREQKLEKAREEKGTPEIINNFFDIYEKLYNEHKYLQRNIWNFDESPVGLI